MQWYNEPPAWHETDSQITMTAGAQTDFWRYTRHTYITDNGNFYYRSVTGDFTATVRVSGAYADQYDQAGLMVRENALIWMKCGIEYVDGTMNASAVITREFSDWSILPLAERPAAVWFRVERIAEAIEVSYSLDGVSFTLIRQGYLSTAPTLEVGVMAAAPLGNGFEATFSDFVITQE
ncbi:DUF1349 domain-containing protein [Oscillatoria laete-virens NRMC-F 0139]|jgi:regulation of enolase protein 1 (concanavalin A-like superfamily)|nr:DUF1349 domain-containing protein [Oscillatoria laete-virens]MDL5055422.1 DUF1349 domain-containing protein [Oscillatoria laete-virens NRMC-F 0139]